MKKIEVIIPDKAFNDVNNILTKSNVGGAIHYRIEGRGRETQTFIPMTKLEVVVKDDQVETLISIIVNKLSINNINGKIFVQNIPIAVDIATKKKGESVI